MNKRYYPLFLIGILFLTLSIDGKHYWHEARFLYASTQFSISDLLNGSFNPHQLGGIVDEKGASGFYLAKVLHVSMLKALFKLIPPHLGGFEIAVCLSFIFMGITSIVCMILYNRLIDGEIDPLLGTLCILTVPLTMYLAGKLLSEVPSLLFVSISILLFKLGENAKYNNKLVYIISCGTFLTLATLSRFDMILCFIGFLIAEIIFSKNRIEMNKIIIKAIVVIALYILAYVTFLYIIINKDFSFLATYFWNFIHLDTKSNIMSIFGFFSFGGVIWIISFFSLYSNNKKLTYYYFTWLSITLIPMILITQNYMVEPRYLASGIIPLAGLGIIGSDVILKKLNLNRSTYWIFIVFAGLIVMNRMITNIMPYELDSFSMKNAIQKISVEDQNAAILIPYAYTDFHYLKIMYPEKSIYNVNYPVGITSNVTEEWKNRLRNWYGSSYIDNEKTLGMILDNQNAYYLGWEKYPPVEHLMGITKYLKLKTVSNFIDRLPLKNHLEESWMWRNSAYKLEFIRKCGQYKYFKVNLIK